MQLQGPGEATFSGCNDGFGERFWEAELETVTMRPSFAIQQDSGAAVPPT